MGSILYKTNSETKTWAQVAYLGVDLKKHKLGDKGTQRVTPPAAPRLEQGLAGSPEQAVVPTSWVWEHRVPSTSPGLWRLSGLHVPPV